MHTYQEYGGAGENSLLPTAKTVKVWVSHHWSAKVVVRPKTDGLSALC